MAKLLVTGERFHPSEKGRIGYEHFHRYAACLEVARGKVVLDVASGEGYGSALLAGQAGNVIGVDLNQAAAEHAKKTYGHLPNLSFVVADCRSIPIGSESVDLIVSFETIEHIERQDELIKEFVRVLRPGGIVIASSPDRENYSEATGRDNPFHLRELTHAQFVRLFKDNFRHVRVFRQRLAVASFVLADEPAGPPILHSFMAGNHGVSPGSQPLRASVYSLVVCGDTEQGLQLFRPSMHLDPEDDLFLEQERKLRWASGVQEQNEILKHHVETAERTVAEERTARNSVNEAATLLTVTLDEVLKERAVAAARYEEVVATLGKNERELVAIQARIAEATAQAKVAADELFAIREDAAATKLTFQQQVASQKSREIDSLHDSKGRRSFLNRVIAKLRRLMPHKRNDTVRDVLGSGLFDADWYALNNPDVQNTAQTPIAHYIQFGWREGRDPHPLFRSQWYLEAFPELLTLRTPPVEHYFRVGWRVGANPHPLFSLEWYLNNNPDIKNSGLEPLTHYLAFGDREGRSPHPLFDSGHYRHENSVEPTTNALVHFITHRGGSPHPLFDPDWYLSNPPALVASEINPLEDYLQRGWRQGRDPHPLFSVTWYLDQNPDVQDAGIDPLTHYVQYGDREGRSPHPLFDPSLYRRSIQNTAEPGANALAHFLAHQRGSSHPLFDRDWYLSNHPDLTGIEINPLEYYLRHGWRQKQDPHPLFSVTWYLAKNPDVTDAGIEPLTHYILHGDRQGRSPHPSFDPIEYRRVTPGAAEPGVNALLHYLLGRNITTILAEEYGQDSANRTLGYFACITALQSRRADAAGRATVIALQVEQLRALASAHADSRPVDISIIVPTFNHVEYTLTCVRSILEHSTKHRYEIIVGNDRSSDETELALAAIGGVVRVITHPVNQGFVRNCNRCAEQAAGHYVVFLNNDTFVLDGWLDSLVAPFEKLPSIGLVGSKLLMPDGSLQEAGGILWRDGSAWNFGRGQDPRLPEFNYLKDTDYVSGASIAVPIVLWREVGGFDERYSPAYCEDADLAFTLRSKGYRTVFQPFSAVIHHEGVSHGTDVGAGIKSYQLENTRKFRDKWRNVLETEHLPNAEDVLLARDRSARRPHIVVIDHYIPQPDKDAGSRTMFQYLRLLVNAGFQVTFLPDNKFHDRPYGRLLQDLGIEVLYNTSSSSVDYEEWFKKNGHYFKYAFLSRAHIAKNYIAFVRNYSNARMLFYGHDIAILRLEQEGKVSKDSRIVEEIGEWREMETLLWSASDVIYYPAEFECEYVRERYPEKIVRQIPAYIYQSSQLPRLETEQRNPPPNLLYVGGFRHRPNIDAVLWFHNEVLPLIRALIPNIVLQIVGSHPPPEIVELAAENVAVTGYLSDRMLDLMYQSSSIAVVPLRYGGGIKGKVIEAFAQGIPVVSTSVGLQGLIGAEECLVLADDAEAFAQAVVRLMKDPELRTHLIKHGRDYIEKHYTARAAIDALALDMPELRHANQEAIDH